MMCSDTLRRVIASPLLRFWPGPVGWAPRRRPSSPEKLVKHNCHPIFSFLRPCRRPEISYLLVIRSESFAILLVAPLLITEADDAYEGSRDDESSPLVRTEIEWDHRAHGFHPLSSRGDRPCRQPSGRKIRIAARDPGRSRSRAPRPWRLLLVHRQSLHPA